jgi:aryl-alcohol dehydrogenase
MKTFAAVSRTARSPFEVVEVDLPPLEPEDVLVRVVGVGLCHTDLASRDGLIGAPFPAIFGHEGSGIVEQIGSSVTKVAVGDHVVLAPDSDGTYPQCQRGHPMYCDSFNELNFQTDPAASTALLADGARASLRYFGQSSFGHHAIAHQRNTIRVNRSVPIELLGPLGCGIQTGAGTVMNGLKPAAGTSLVVLGVGAVGLAAVLGAVVCGCSTVIAVDIHQSRLAMALDMGATHAIDTSNGNNAAVAIKAILPAGADYIVDAAGVPSLIVEALGALARLGTLGLVAVPPWFPIILAGQSVQGFVEGNSIPDLFIPQMVALYKQGRFPFDKMLRSYPFDQINTAVADQLSGATIKAVLHPETGQ